LFLEFVDEGNELNIKKNNAIPRELLKINSFAIQPRRETLYEGCIE